MAVPETVIQPQDHVQAVKSDDELLEGLPPLTPPNRLRLRSRNRIMRLAIRLRGILPEGAEEFDTDALSEEQFGTLLDVLAEVDEFAEAIAVDSAAYVAWAEGADYAQFTAILSRYSSAVGESSSSSTSTGSTAQS